MLGVVLIVSIPDICLFLTFYTHTSTDSQEIPYTDQIVVGCPLGVPIS